eukprot:7113168-Alexandrium_andersonii.AAC.1
MAEEGDTCIRCQAVMLASGHVGTLRHMELPGLCLLRQAQAHVARLSMDLDDSFLRWHFARLLVSA